MIRDMWAEGEHLLPFYSVTNLDARGFTRFMWDGKCPSEGAIPLHDREPYTTELTRKLLRNVGREMLDDRPFSPGNFLLFSALKQHLSHPFHLQ